MDGSAIDLDVLLSTGSRADRRTSFGYQYASFMKRHGFDPDERADIRFIADPDLAYIMLRYRQVSEPFSTASFSPSVALMIMHTAYGIRHTAYGIRHTAYGIRHTAYGIRHTAYGFAAFARIQTAMKMYHSQLFHSYYPSRAPVKNKVPRLLAYTHWPAPHRAW